MQCNVPSPLYNPQTLTVPSCPCPLSSPAYAKRCLVGHQLNALIVPIVGTLCNLLPSTVDPIHTKGSSPPAAMNSPSCEKEMERGGCCRSEPAIQWDWSSGRVQQATIESAPEVTRYRPKGSN